MTKIEQLIKRQPTPAASIGNNDVSYPLKSLLARQPFFRGLNAQHLDRLAGLAMQIQFRPGQFIFQQGDPANRFYLILEGQVELEIDSKNAGVMSVLTLRPGDNLGWSWLFPPHSFHVSARAVEPIRAIFFYGTILRQFCEDDPDFGYELMKRVAEVVVVNFTSLQEKLAEYAETGVCIPEKRPALSYPTPYQP